MTSSTMRGEGSSAGVSAAGWGGRLLHLRLYLHLGLAAAAFGLAGCGLYLLYGLRRLFLGRGCRFGLLCGDCLHREFGFRFDLGQRRRSGRFGLRQPRTASARGFLPNRCAGSLLFLLLLFRFCGSGLLRGSVSGYFRYQFALLDHDVLDAQRLSDFTQFGKAFSFQRFQILHIVVLFNVIFKNRTVARFVRIRLQR